MENLPAEPQETGTEQRFQGDLNLIHGPTTTPGGENNPTTHRIIEFNDGKVCWYYPVFPEVVSTNVASARERQWMEEYEDFSYDESPVVVNAPVNGRGDYPWVPEEYYSESEWFGQQQQQRVEGELIRRETLPPNPNEEGHLANFMIQGQQPGAPAADGNSSMMHNNYKYSPFNGTRWLSVEINFVDLIEIIWFLLFIKKTTK